MEYDHLRPFAKTMIRWHLKWLLVIISIVILPPVAIIMGIGHTFKIMWDLLGEIGELIRVKKPPRVIKL